MENSAKATSGIELIKRPDATAEDIAELIFGLCPQFDTLDEDDIFCDDNDCRACWLAWLTTGKPRPDPRKKK